MPIRHGRRAGAAADQQQGQVKEAVFNDQWGKWAPPPNYGVMFGVPAAIVCLVLAVVGALAMRREARRNLELARSRAHDQALIARVGRM